MNTRLNRVIAIWEMIGGFLGIIVSIRYLFVQNVTLKNLPAYALFIGLYVLSGMAGLFLWKNQRRGILLSMLIQALQIPVLTSPVFIYLFTLPLAIVLMLYGVFTGPETSIGFHVQVILLPDWALKFQGIAGQFVLGVNVIALICLGYLFSQFRKRPTSVPLADGGEEEIAGAQGLDSESSASDEGEEGTGD